jgi:hypothetical protein
VREDVPAMCSLKDPCKVRTPTTAMAAKDWDQGREAARQGRNGIERDGEKEKKRGEKERKKDKMRLNTIFFFFFFFKL